MKKNTSLKMIAVFLGVALTLLLTMLAVLPLLNKILAVEVMQPEAVTEAPVPLPAVPETVLLTAIYEMESDSKKISGITIEIFHVENDTAAYFAVPVDTKVNLSEALYKSLQTYAPELPQYLKLSNMAESFSAEYGLTGCNRIVSEVLGVSITNYVRADKETVLTWKEQLAQEKTGAGFFDAYANWLNCSESNLTTEERWMYYESLRRVAFVVTETAPGSQEKDGYLLSTKRSKERLQELMLRKQPAAQE